MTHVNPLQSLCDRVCTQAVLHECLLMCHACHVKHTTSASAGCETVLPQCSVLKQQRLTQRISSLRAESSRTIWKQQSLSAWLRRQMPGTVLRCKATDQTLQMQTCSCCPRCAAQCCPDCQGRTTCTLIRQRAHAPELCCSTGGKGGWVYCMLL